MTSASQSSATPPAPKTARGAAAPTKGTGSLRKALRLMSRLAESDQDGLRLTELVGRSDLDPATAYRMLACLVEEGFVQKQPGKRYRLGRRMFELGLVAGHFFPERVQAHWSLCRLAHTVGAAAVLSARSGDETVYIDRVDGPGPLAGLRTALGTRLPIGIGAGGVALLAAMEPSAADAVISSNAARYRRFGWQAPDLLRRRIAEAKHQGFAVTESFLRPGTWAMGVVVPDHGLVPGLVPGFAIGIVGASDMTRRLARELHAVATEIAEVIELDAAAAPRLSARPPGRPPARPRSRVGPHPGSG